MKQLIAVSVFLGILGGLLIHSYQIYEPTPIVYASEPEEPREVLIEVKPTERTIEEKIRATFPEEPDRAVKVAKAESGLKASAYNPESHKDRNGNIICNGSVGVMQIGCVHHKSDVLALHDVDLNLKIARKLWEEQGWRPWGVCRNGTVDCGI